MSIGLPTVSARLSADTRRAVLLSAVCTAALFAAPSRAQQPQPPEGPPRAWVQAAVNNELKIIAPEGEPSLRFRQRKIDARGDTTREIVETRDGSVARLIERDGQPITAAEDAAERSRLTDLLNNPEEFEKHHHRDNSSRDYAMQIVRQLPQAMIYSYTPGQPQPPNAEGPQVVIDFHSDPSYHPSGMFSDVLTGLEGRAWIDAKAQRVTRIEARVLRPVSIGFGIVAKVFPGGTMEFEQISAGGDRWVYHHLEEHLTVRELMVKTVPQNSEVTSSDFRPMPSQLPYQDAIKLLLAMQIPLR
jgi:hypothetical protein